MNFNKETVHELIECTMERVSKRELPPRYVVHVKDESGKPVVDELGTLKVDESKSLTIAESANFFAAESANFLAAAALLVGGAGREMGGIREETHTELSRLRKMEGMVKSLLCDLQTEGVISDSELVAHARTILEKVF